MTRICERELRYQVAIRGLDQQALADAAGMSQATASRAMAGGRVRRSTLLRLARALCERRPLPELKGLIDSEAIHRDCLASRRDCTSNLWLDSWTGDRSAGTP